MDRIEFKTVDDLARACIDFNRRRAEKCPDEQWEDDEMAVECEIFVLPDCDRHMTDVPFCLEHG